MWITGTAQQAIRAVLCIAQGAGDPVRVDDIAVETAWPRNYLSKTLHALTVAGVLRSARGPRGGFRLASAADELTLARVIAPFERAGERRCLLGRPTCRDSDPCNAHHEWNRVAAAMEKFFQTTTIAHLLRENSRPPKPRKSHGSVSRKPG